MADKQPKLEVVSDTPKDAADIEALWLDPALGDGITDVHWHSIPIGKPKDFFRVHPDKNFRRRTEIFLHKPEDAIEETFYIIDPAMRGKVPEARPCTLVSCVYRDGSPRLWPIMFPRLDERDNEAWISARAAARTAIEKWVKLVWTKRSYATRDAQPGYAPDPNWEKLPPFNEMVEIAFGATGIIRDVSHSIYRDLIGAPAVKSDDAGDL